MPLHRLAVRWFHENNIEVYVSSNGFMLGSHSKVVLDHINAELGTPSKCDSIEIEGIVEILKKVIL